MADRLPSVLRVSTSHSTEASGGVPRPPGRWKTRVLLPALLLAGMAMGSAYAARDALWPAVEVEVIPVVVGDASTARAAPRGGGVMVQAPGWIEPEPFATRVAALREGVVASVLVLEGQAVEAGQVVVRLNEDDVRMAMTKAEAQLAHAQADLEAAGRALGQVGESSQQLAAEGSAWAELAAELAKLPAETAVHEAKVSQLQIQLNARRQAVQQNVVSPVQVELLEASLRAAEAELEATRRQEAVLVARLDWRRSELKSNLAMAQARLQVAQAERQQAAMALARSEIVSPMTGVVLSRQVEPGSHVSIAEPESTTVLRLYDPAKLQVRVDVAQAQAGRIGVGQPAQIVVDGLPEHAFTGHVTRVMHEADIGRNTLQFKVSIDQPLPQLKPQMAARVRLLASVEPGDASSPNGQRMFAPVRIVGSEPGSAAEVWLVDHQQRAGLRSITLGELRQGQWMEIRSGLNPGDRLIANPPADLKPGQRVNAREISQASDTHAGGER